MSHTQTVSDAIRKAEHFCAYQERCHQEVVSKLRNLALGSSEIDDVIVHLIAGNYLNEERFAQAFARGKHRISNWGRVRIVNELKFRDVSQRNINTALKEIDPDDYAEAFNTLAERHWESLPGRDSLKKRKKFCDYLLRKGYESDLVYQKAKALEQSEG
jgi:regulatory protein